jgi:hypothetical protein
MERLTMNEIQSARCASDGAARCDGASVSRGSFRLVVEEDDSPDASWMEAHGFEDDLRSWRAGETAALYCYVSVTINGRRFRSPGVGGVFVFTHDVPGYGEVPASSIKSEYLRDIFSEEENALTEELKSQGFKVWG